MPGDITAALRRIKNTSNVNIIEDKAKVCAMLSDLEPSLHKERRRIKLLYETGAIHSLAKAVSNPEGARLYLSQAASILTDEADMNADAAAETVNYFAPLWNLPRVESRGAASAAIDTDAMFDMMAKQDEEKKKKNAQKNAYKQTSYGGKPQVYGQRIQVRAQGQGRQQGAAPGMSSAAFTQPLKGAGRQQTTQRVNTYNPTGTMSRAGAQAQTGRQQKQRQIYGSYANNGSGAGSSATNTAPAQSGAANTGVQSGTSMFQRGAQSRWKNIAVKVRQSSGMPAVATSVTMAQQAAEDLCRFYGAQLPACGNDTVHADKLCRKAVWLTALSPARAVDKFLEAAIEGDVSHLSLFGRQILAWPDYLGLETAMGFACLQMAVDRGAERGAFALAHCYHTGTGICKCSELAKKYYHQAELKHPEISEQIKRRLEQLKRGEEPTDKLWRFY